MSENEDLQITVIQRNSKQKPVVKKLDFSQDIKRKDKPIPYMQLIDQDGNFADENQTERETFEHFLSNNSDFIKRGVNYNMLSILGPQNSGKSTLLNHLFGTKFAVLDDQRARERTTRGIWVGLVGYDEDTMIMDLEGSDGSSREDDYAFERKISLFSLSVCSV